MRQRNMMNGFDMEQHSHPNIPPMNPVPTFENNNNSMFNGIPHYPPHPHHHHHQGASDPGPSMSTPPSLYLPYAPLHAPPSHPLAPGTHGASDPHFMGHGYKRKSSEAIPGNYQYLNESAASCSFPPETAPFPFPHYPTSTSYPQPIDQRSVRSRVGGAVSMDPPPYSHVNYGPHHVPPIWYDQHVNDDTSDGSSSSFWLQPPPSVPFMHGNGSIDSGNVCLPRFNEASSSRNDGPLAYPMPNYFTHHQAPPPRPPPPAVYPRMAPASYTAPYSHARPVQSPGFRMSLQHPRDDFFAAATLRYNGLSHLRAIPAYEDEGDFYDDYVDDHEDMRLDIEDMSYEELLALSEDIGTVKTGLSEETVKDLVKRRTSISTRINLEEAPPSTDLETDFCTICQENYKNQEKIATLDCKHEYHAECLEKWLVIKNVCPICKSEALVTEKNKERSSIGG
ncbi:unnamed protein product [Eruca vesicaria subsp. sativa]|uniref:RING-type E3 ubiquitin transferase n=1 Tax=Eruca vesicaria subsp. sativa TaxID=29727 RepID=A0ABC8KIH0_ERUVS|nr:unnamed protein product [Eruca vesicaria subsp. sativa]